MNRAESLRNWRSRKNSRLSPPEQREFANLVANSNQSGVSCSNSPARRPSRWAVGDVKLCGLSRSFPASLWRMDAEMQRRKGWVASLRTHLHGADGYTATRRPLGIVDLIGMGGHIRTVPLPDWVKQQIDKWRERARISTGKVFRCVCRAGKIWGDHISEQTVWHVVKSYAARLGLERLAPHDLCRSCARLCHTAGGELEEIQFLVGHASVQTMERYLGWKQRLHGAVNDLIGIEPSL